MPRHHYSLCCLVTLLILPGVAFTQETVGLPARLQAVVAGYEKLVEELDLNRLPGDRPDYLWLPRTSSGWASGWRP